MIDSNEVPIWEKFMLSIKEASKYFNINEKKIRKILDENIDSDFVLQNGTKMLIKREQFEGFLKNTSSI